MKMSHLKALLIVLGLAGVAQADPVRQLQPYSCCELAKVHVADNVLLASQPSPEGLKEAKTRGVRTVVNLRYANEINWDQAAYTKQLGMEYYNIPFNSGQTLTDEVLNQVRRVLNGRKNSGLLLHCASANRVGAVWLVHRVLDGGIAYDQALAEAKAVGLRSAEYEARARDYIRRARS
jgi:protein tyrosine phosphatase (PTP) superfamily phosphohydrolase (DUF442 family)